MLDGTTVVDEIGRPARPVDVTVLTGAAPGVPALTVVDAEGPADLAAYHALRRRTFVDEQRVFDGTDHDDVDDLPATVVLVARAPGGAVVGGVRIAPAVAGEDLAWWRGSRLVVEPSHRGAAVVGAALVRAACETAERLGALRFEADVRADRHRFFTALGWHVVGPVAVHGVAHLRMRWPIGRLARQAATKAPLGHLLDNLAPGGPGWVGDDAAPVPGAADLVAACDAVAPAMVERDPWWAGWCSVLVNVNDVTVKGATPVGLLDAVAAPTASHAGRVLSGLRAAAAAWDVDILGGHTTLGVHASLAVTMLGRTAGRPVPGGGGRPGDDLSVVADLAGGWRAGYRGRQWDSTTTRATDELRSLAGLVARWAPAAAKDVSMAGLVGTLGMMAEASGCGAELRVADIPRPGTDSGSVTLADWLCCFPGFAVVLADRPGRAVTASPAPATAARCGTLTGDAGVRLLWPDGVSVEVVGGAVTGLGPATGTTATTLRSRPEEQLCPR